MDANAGALPAPPIRIDEILSRNLEPGDMDFILSTWLKCYRRHSLFTRNISNPVFFEWHQRLIKRLFTRGAIAHMAALKEDPLVIIGYLVVEPLDQLSGMNPILHFAYVKYSFRSAGIMRHLLQAARIDLKEKTEYTHHTFEIEPIVNKHPRLQFNPYLL